MPKCRHAWKLALIVCKWDRYTVTLARDYDTCTWTTNYRSYETTDLAIWRDALQAVARYEPEEIRWKGLPNVDELLLEYLQAGGE